jgi:Tautomerase enzyme
MPVAKVYLPEGILTPDQRRDIVKGIHDVIVAVEKRPENELAQHPSAGPMLFSFAQMHLVTEVRAKNCPHSPG